MKRFSTIITLLLIVGVIYWSFNDLKPSVNSNLADSKKSFSTVNALFHIKQMSKKPHYVGSKNHAEVRQYIVKELEKLGLNVNIQTETVVNKKWFAATTVQNIVARIKGSGNTKNKALLLLSHYDSNPHSSLGASDAASGVATILEGIRAFLATNKTPKNDIIILISDAEELGLLGAQAFVEHHKWAKDIGLVLNFEARGSGGPSFMLMETNGKNSALLKAFLKSKPNYPTSNSLLYSIYKTLPNDTDLTVFRQQADINGFNFAFIGDHFDYHTAQDSYSRLDKTSLLHQADYFTTGINYFSNADLTTLNSDTDDVFVNLPFIKTLHFPFFWVTPLVVIAILLFVTLLFFGLGLNKLDKKQIFYGFLAFILALIACASITFILWQIVLYVYPSYTDILHGFTYNGYIYILAIVFLNATILLGIYKRFCKKANPLNLIVAPVFFWLVLNVLVALYLKGAGFFIIPVFCSLLVLAIGIFMNLDARAFRILATIISIPTLYIFAPLIQLFPIGLGLSMLVVSALILALVFGLLLISFHQKKHFWLYKVKAILALIFFTIANFNSGFTKTNKAPNSLVYVQNTDTNTAYFGSYNTTLDPFTAQVFNTKDTILQALKNQTTKSKYNTGFKHVKITNTRPIPAANVSINLDTLIGNKRFIDLTIQPNRKVHKLEFVTKTKLKLHQFKVNYALANSGKPYVAKPGSFLIYHLSNLDTEVSLSFNVNKDQPLALLFNEVSYDLLTNPNFNLLPRDSTMMPMPFVTNDAILLSKTIALDNL